jgi:putative hydroxymethylpyrimidine transport system ATP-binding protein
LTDFRNQPAASQNVSLHGATLRYGSALLFENLTLNLLAGQTTCLLGPSGVGKSSLLRLIAGLEPLTAPTIFTGPEDTPGKNIAYMAQQDLLLPWLSALENVLLGSRLRGGPADRMRALGLLESVGLAGHETVRPAKLSGGMRQRVALARTLMEDRPLVLMDEPFSSLDAITRMNLQDLAADLLRDKTVLVVTHDPMEAVRIADRILIMQGQPAELREVPVAPNPPPRDPASRAVLDAQGDLLRELAAIEVPG